MSFPTASMFLDSFTFKEVQEAGDQGASRPGWPLICRFRGHSEPRVWLEALLAQPGFLLLTSCPIKAPLRSAV